MSAHTAHQLDVSAAFLTLVGWALLMVLLENVSDQRVRWVRFASFGPIHQAYDRLPDYLGPLHGVLLVAIVLWLAAVLVPGSKLRSWLFIATAACLAFLAAAFAIDGPN